MTTTQRPSADDPRILLDQEAGVFEPVPPYPPRTEREVQVEVESVAATRRTTRSRQVGADHQLGRDLEQEP